MLRKYSTEKRRFNVNNKLGKQQTDVVEPCRAEWIKFLERIVWQNWNGSCNVFMYWLFQRSLINEVKVNDIG